MQPNFLNTFCQVEELMGGIRKCHQQLREPPMALNWD